MSKSRTFHAYNLERLKKPEDARRYLEVALEEYERDGDMEAFLLALRDVTDARGGVGALARRTRLPRQSLYKMLSAKGNPTVGSLGTVLHGLGFRFAIAPLR